MASRCFLSVLLSFVCTISLIHIKIMMTTSLVPVVAAYSGVRQTGVTRDVDAVGVGIQLGAAATAARVGDVTVQHGHNVLQRCEAVQGRLWCILGR